MNKAAGAGLVGTSTGHGDSTLRLIGALPTIIQTTNNRSKRPQFRRLIEGVDIVHFKTIVVNRAWVVMCISS
jgi:hypothetical protein